MTLEFAEGAPYWVDLSAPDVPAASRFYRDLFGWEAQDLGEESGHYTMLSYQGKDVCAIGPSFGTGETGAWMPYFKSHDPHERTRAIEASGGTVRMPPMDVFDQTTLAQFTDPAGVEFAISQPKGHKGAQLWQQDGAVSWFELVVRDPEPSLGFYKEVFGWSTKTEDMGDGSSYTTMTARDAPLSFAGLVVMDETFPDGTPPHWRVYFQVPDAQKAADKAVELGGRQVDEIASAPGIGSWTALTDPDQVKFSVIAEP